MFEAIRGRFPRIGKWPRIAVAACCGLLALESAASARSTTPRPATPGVRVVVAARDLPAGRVLTRRDLATAQLPTDATPASSLRRFDAVLGQRLAAPLARRELVTRTRLLGRDLTTGLAADEVAVPVPLADPRAGELIHPGDFVDLLATGPLDAAVPSDTRASAAVTVVGRRLLVLAVLPASTAESDQRTGLVVRTKPDIALRITQASASQTLAAVGVPP